MAGCPCDDCDCADERPCTLCTCTGVMKPRIAGIESEFHRAWAFAKEHPEMHTVGYDKESFIHVQFWLDKIKYR